MCYVRGVSSEISQRELRNNSGDIMRRLDEGEAFIVTRNGVPVGELMPMRRRRVVNGPALAAAFRGAPRIDHQLLRADLDRAVDLESWVEPVPVDGDCARAYGRIYAAVVAAGRQPRPRAADLLIAATALAAGMPLYTRNAGDFSGLEQILTVVAV